MHTVAARTEIGFFSLSGPDSDCGQARRRSGFRGWTPLLAPLLACGLPAAAVRADDFPSRFELRHMTAEEGLRIVGEAGLHSGSAVAGAGDVNGDGFDDVLIGAPYDLNVRGAAYVVFGRPRGRERIKLSGINGSTGFRISGSSGSGQLGSSVSSAGDLNGDGIDDIAIGAPRSGTGELRGAGEVLVVFGSTAGFPARLDAAYFDGTKGFRIIGTTKNGGIGGALASAGDVNGDGVADMLIGGSNSDGKSEYAYLIFGSTSGFPPVLDLKSIDGHNGVRLKSPKSDSAGLAIAGAGDINGDGFDDVLIGDPYPDFDLGYPNGLAYVLYGHAEQFSPEIILPGLVGRAGFIMTDLGGRFLGGAVGGGHDVNGDGLSDFILGDLTYQFRSKSNSGKAIVVFGRSTPFPSPLVLKDLKPSQKIEIVGTESTGRVGQSVALVRDVNGDGIDDVVVGAPFVPLYHQNGASYVVFGDRKKFRETLMTKHVRQPDGFAVLGVDDQDHEGEAVAGAGDFDGDGIGDLVTGAPDAATGDSLAAGESYVVYGR